MFAELLMAGSCVNVDNGWGNHDHHVYEHRGEISGKITCRLRRVVNFNSVKLAWWRV